MTMQFMPKNFTILIFFFLSVIGCSKQRIQSEHFSPQDSIRIVNEIIAHRSEADSFFRNDPDSPFNKDTTVHYEGIKWFPPDVRYVFRTRLFRYERPEQVTILGTKGEERTMVRYGYIIIPLDEKEFRLNVYKSPDRNDRHLAVWFTDETTGKQTYPVGRYVDMEDEQPDPQYLYTINLNNAYNPYCAYSSLYTCAVPRKEDHLDFSVLAGELKYHQ